MVMFRDEEAAMIRAERAARPRWRKILSRTLKIAFWSCALFYVCLLILSRLGGRSDAMKTGLEQYLAQATGMAAHVGYLNHMAFYPLAGVDFDDLTLDKPKAKDQIGGTVRVGHAVIVMHFMDLLRSRSALAALDLADLAAAAGTLDARPLTIARMTIDQNATPPRLTARGGWGGQAFDAAIDLQRAGSAFILAVPAPFRLSLGPFKAQGTARWDRARSGLTLAFDVTTPQTAHGTLALRPDNTGQQAELQLTSPDGTLALHASRRYGQAFDGAVTVQAADAVKAARLLMLVATLARTVPDRPVIRVALTGPSCHGVLTIAADGDLQPGAAALCPVR